MHRRGRLLNQREYWSYLVRAVEQQNLRYLLSWARRSKYYNQPCPKWLYHPIPNSNWNFAPCHKIPGIRMGALKWARRNNWYYNYTGYPFRLWWKHRTWYLRVNLSTLFEGCMSLRTPSHLELKCSDLPCIARLLSPQTQRPVVYTLFKLRVIVCLPNLESMWLSRPLFFFSKFYILSDIFVFD